MCCGITSMFILGPYFFEEVTGGDLQTCAVTSACYLDMLTHYEIPNCNGKVLYLKLCGCKMACRVFRQTSLKSTVWWQSYLRHFPFPLPQRSTDLTSMVFWLREYVKFKVLQFHPQSVSDFKDAIRIAIQEISIAMIRAAVLSTI